MLGRHPIQTPREKGETMNPKKKPNGLRIVIWLVYLIISIVLIWFAGGFALLMKKTEPALNIPVLAIACLIVLFSIVRIYLEVRTTKVKPEPEASTVETPLEVESSGVVEDEIKICIHCGKAEPLDTVYCSSCGGRFPD
jgi:hypothetical protein